MAAKQLDDAWGGWATALSESYETTRRLLGENKIAEARSEFRGHFLVTVREVYSEAAVVSPERFSKSTTWNAWVRLLYGLSSATDRVLRGSDPASGTEEAAAMLGKLREHFYQLRLTTETRKSNDYIHAFQKEAMKENPSASELKSLRDAVIEADPSRKAKADAEAYGKAMDDWARRVDSLLADGNVAASERAPLREATRLFYSGYGMQIE